MIGFCSQKGGYDWSYTTITAVITFDLIGYEVISKELSQTRLVTMSLGVQSITYYIARNCRLISSQLISQ